MATYNPSLNKNEIKAPRVIITDGKSTCNITIDVDEVINIDAPVRADKGIIIDELDKTVNTTKPDVSVGTLTNGLVRVDEQKGGIISIGNISGGSLWIDDLGASTSWPAVSLAPYDTSFPDGIIHKGDIKANVFYWVKYYAKDSSTFNSAVVMFCSENATATGINISGATGSSDRILLIRCLDNLLKTTTWKNCTYLQFFCLNNDLSKVTYVGSFTDFRELPINIDFRKMYN